MVYQRELEGKDREQASADVTTGEKRQRLAVVLRGEEPMLLLLEGSAKMRSWPLHAVKLSADQPGGNITIEAGGETLTWSCASEDQRRELARVATALTTDSGRPLGHAALGALLEDAAPDDADAELWVKKLAEKLAELDALNVAGMLAAATEGGGAQLASRLEAGVTAGTALSARLARYEAQARGGAEPARGGAARADANARALLAELTDIYEWLDAAPLSDLDSLSQVSLTTAEGRARAQRWCEALRAALQHTAVPAPRLRLAAVQDRLRRLTRAKEQLAAALARHLNNALIHLGNEASSQDSSRRHHTELQPYAPFMRWLKDTDDKACPALAKVYVSTWSRVYEREVKAACDAARAQLAATPPARADEQLDQVLTLVENICNAEQDFCTQFFLLDVDIKSENSDGERSEKSDGAKADGGRRASAETRRFMGELFPSLEPDLVALVAHIEKQDPYGAMVALSVVGRRVVGGEQGSARWARAALAAVAVAAKRQADRIVADTIAALPDRVKQASKKQKCGILPFVTEFEELSRSCEAIFSGATRRADLERWYLALVTAMLHAIQHADHPRTPKAVVHTENYHRLHAVVSALRVPALEAVRRECRARYADALRAYVTQYFGRPLEKLTLFFEGVAEAVAGGVREDEVCYRAAFSKHELRRILAMYPAHEVRKSMHRLYRTVEKHLSEEDGLLQVVWRAMQEEFLAQHRALETRIAACYPGAGLTLPLTTQDILEAFSDIAREH